MPKSSSNTRWKGKGPGRKRKRGKTPRHAGPRTTETAPNILAALEAQRARALQQSLATLAQEIPVAQSTAPAVAPATATQDGPPPPLPTSPPSPLPGYMFDPARNRFFRMVKDSLGTPGNVRNSSSSNNNNNKSGSRRKLRIPIALGANQRTRPPPPPQPAEGRRAVAWGLENSTVSSTTAVCVACPTTAEAGGAVVGPGVAPRVGPWREPSWRRGLHSYAMNSRRGFMGSERRVHRPRVLPARSAQHHRAGIEAIVSSSRFRLRSSGSLTQQADGTSLSTIGWDAEHGVVAVGTSSGALGIMKTRRDDLVRGGSASGRDGEPRGVFDQGRGGVQEGGWQSVWWDPGASYSCGQVSDVKFRTRGSELACATAYLGCAGEPGGVTVRFWPRGLEQEGARRDTVDIVSNARTVTRRVRQGSVWCAEWNPFKPEELAVGPSSCCPVALLHVERGVLTPVAKLSSDVFSLSFVPTAAPGAGSAFVCGLRDGSVLLVDPRQPPHHNRKTSGGVPGGRSGYDSGSSRHGNRFAKEDRLGLSNADLLARIDFTSVDHVQVLRDGTCCLVKDRSGALQTLDLRVFGGEGRGSGRRPGALNVLVPPREPGAVRGSRATVPGSFVLDPTETVVATPVSTAAAAAGGGGSRCRSGGGGGGGVRGAFDGSGASAISGAGAWGAFSTVSPSVLRQDQTSGIRHHRSPSGTDVNDAGTGVGGDIDAPMYPGGDRLRILNVSSGLTLNDVQTPWTGISLARGSVAGFAGAEGNPSGIPRFWGTAWEHGCGATVFEAGLRSEDKEGYGRL